MDQSIESSLKISNIQSLQEETVPTIIKKEKEAVESSIIKIRSISEINQISQSPQISNDRSVLISKQHPSQQLLSKHIVVRKVPNIQKKPVLTKISSNGQSKLSQQPIPDDPVKPQTNFPISNALEQYIKEIEEQNREMKKVLMECRREVVSVQMRTHKLTNLINSTIAKCNSKRPITTNITKQHTSPLPIPIPVSLVSPQQHSILNKKTFKIMQRKNNVTAKGNVVCRVPVFPINRLTILKQLELDLSKKEFSEYVFQKLYNVNNKTDIDKPSVLLNNTLNSMIDPKLMGHFQYEESAEKNESSECEYFKSLQRVRVLYGKLVNALSNTIFAKSVDMVALEKFVKNKISGHRSEYLAAVERLKNSRNTSNTEIKTEKIEPDNGLNVSNVNEGNLRWLDEEEEDEAMNTEED